MNYQNPTDTFELIRERLITTIRKAIEKRNGTIQIDPHPASLLPEPPIVAVKGENNRAYGTFEAGTLHKLTINPRTSQVLCTLKGESGEDFQVPLHSILVESLQQIITWLFQHMLIKGYVHEPFVPYNETEYTHLSELIFDLTETVTQSQIHISPDSRARWQEIKYWAEEFTQQYQNYEWDTEELDYMEAVERFAEKNFAKFTSQKMKEYTTDLTKETTPKTSDLKITTEAGDTFDIYLCPNRFPNAYQRKVEELMESCGLSQKEAEVEAYTQPIQLELFYAIDQGLFAVESEALDSCEIYNPYTGQEIPNENL